MDDETGVDMDPSKGDGWLLAVGAATQVASMCWRSAHAYAVYNEHKDPADAADDAQGPVVEPAEAEELARWALRQLQKPFERDSNPVWRPTLEALSTLRRVLVLRREDEARQAGLFDADGADRMDVDESERALAQAVVDAGAVAYLAPLINHPDAKLKRQVCGTLAHIAKVPLSPPRTPLLHIPDFTALFVVAAFGGLGGGGCRGRDLPQHPQLPPRRGHHGPQERRHVRARGVQAHARAGQTHRQLGRRRGLGRVRLGGAGEQQAPGHHGHRIYRGVLRDPRARRHRLQGTFFTPLLQRTASSSWNAS